MKLDYYAIITISNCRVHLDTTFNPCASEPIQIENYGHNGWYICQHCPLLKYAFWPTWCEWNGLVLGSIYLTDNQSIRAINKILNRFAKAYSPNEIAALKDGTYLIYAND